MPTDAERRRIAEHLRYEIAMLWATGSEIRRGAYPWAARNSLVESFALHARNVVDFFFTEPVDDDVVARHFFKDESSWVRVRPEIRNHSPLQRSARTKRSPISPTAAWPCLPTTSHGQ
jgi:hypothetical protein